MTAWRLEGLRVASTRRMDAAALPAEAGELQILDVREQAEWDRGHIPGSLHAPWHDIGALPDGLDPARPVAVACASGQRAAVAASLLQRHGAQDVIHVVGGGVPDVIEQ
jgi:hydroxyacylglutathione hydrolase